MLFNLGTSSVTCRTLDTWSIYFYNKLIPRIPAHNPLLPARYLVRIFLICRFVDSQRENPRKTAQPTQNHHNSLSCAGCAGVVQIHAKPTRFVSGWFRIVLVLANLYLLLLIISFRTYLPTGSIYVWWRNMYSKRLRLRWRCWLHQWNGWSRRLLCYMSLQIPLFKWKMYRYWECLQRSK